LKDRLVGSWKLISRRSERTNGELIADPGLAATPSGLLIYDNLGHVAAQLARQGRTIEGIRNECGSLATMQTSPNSANTTLGYDAYYGTYMVNQKDGTVTHHLEAAVWPGNVGTDITRAVRLEGDTLTLAFTTTTSDGQPVRRTLVWLRMK
jgi:hypothetical protein